MKRITFPPAVTTQDGKVITCGAYICSILDAWPTLGKGSENRRAHAAIDAMVRQATEHVDLPAEALTIIRQAIEEVAITPAIGRLMVEFDLAIIGAADVGPDTVAPTPF
jgi:hypothetical protein